jgi:galactokinase
LATDYETSSPTMDQAVAELLTRPGVLGARMTGGGFGGCVVAIRRR